MGARRRAKSSASTPSSRRKKPTSKSSPSSRKSLSSLVTGSETPLPERGIVQDDTKDWIRRAESDLPRAEALGHHLKTNVLPSLDIDFNRYLEFDVTETERKAIFIAMYAEFGNWRAGSRFIKASRGEIRKWRENDEEFRTLMEDSYEEHIDGNETEAFRRAVVGTRATDPMVYSDGLLTTLLKGQRPDRYGKQVLSGPNDGPIQITKVERVIIRPGEVPSE